MKNTLISDFEHPAVVRTLQELTRCTMQKEKVIEAIFLYVRDRILFGGFPPKGDLTLASETIGLGYGQCNTKSALFLALLKAAGIPARIHFSWIRREIQQGLFTGLLFHLMPKELSHSWIEVQHEGAWRPIDSFINDSSFYRNGKKRLQKEGLREGYSVSCRKAESRIDFTLSGSGFVQMDSVTRDLGWYDDPSVFYASADYTNRPGPVQLLVYRLAIGGINRKIASIRSEDCNGGYCGIDLPTAASQV